MSMNQISVEYAEKTIPKVEADIERLKKTQTSNADTQRAIKELTRTRDLLLSVIEEEAAA